jgi:photosystem I P700 chlorophyll a apoprotein A2
MVTTLGMNNLAVWAWMFLFGHLVWATGFMFLISWRGYWQELIETIVWAHERTPLANLIVGKTNQLFYLLFKHV